MQQLSFSEFLKTPDGHLYIFFDAAQYSVLHGNISYSVHLFLNQKSF